MRKLIVFLFASFITFFVVASNPNVSKQVTVNGIQYYQYTVQKSEGFYAISTKFGVTQDDIILANPSTKEGLRVGQEILIPIKTEAKKDDKKAAYKAAKEACLKDNKDLKGKELKECIISKNK